MMSLGVTCNDYELLGGYNVWDNVLYLYITEIHNMLTVVTKCSIISEVVFITLSWKKYACLRANDVTHTSLSFV